MLLNLTVYVAPVATRLPTHFSVSSVCIYNHRTTTDDAHLPSAAKNVAGSRDGTKHSEAGRTRSNIKVDTEVGISVIDI